MLSRQPGEQVDVSSPHAKQVMINERLGLETNLGEKVGDFGVTL